MSLWTFFEILVNLYQGFLMVFFMKRRLNVVRNNHFIDIGFVIAIGSFFSLYLFYDISLPDTVVFALPFIFACLISDDRWYIKLFWTIVLATILIVIISLIRNLYLHIPNVSWELIMAESELRMGFVVSCNIAMLLAIFFISRFNPRRTVLSWLPQIIFLMLIAVQLLTIELLFTIRLETNAADSVFILADISIMCSSIISLVLYEILSSTSEKHYKAEAKLFTLQAAQQHQNELQSLYSNMLAYQHDLTHQLQTLEYLITNNKAPENLSHAIESIRAEISSNYGFSTGCVAIDAVLTTKKMEMDKNDITFNFTPYPMHRLPIDEYKFVVLLANILDNAIEGVMRLPKNSPKRAISLSFSCSWDMFYLICSNDMLPTSIRRSGLRFLSSKKDASLHGHGTESIKNITEHAGGYCEFTINDSLFKVKAVIPYGNEEKNDAKNE